MQILNRAKYVMTGEDGASNLEIIVWMSVVLVIAGFLFAFRNQIGEFLNGVTARLNQQKGAQQKLGSFLFQKILFTFI